MAARLRSRLSFARRKGACEQEAEPGTPVTGQVSGLLWHHRPDRKLTGFHPLGWAVRPMGTHQTPLIQRPRAGWLEPNRGDLLQTIARSPATNLRGRAGLTGSCDEPRVLSTQVVWADLPPRLAIPGYVITGVLSPFPRGASIALPCRLPRMFEFRPPLPSVEAILSFWRRSPRPLRFGSVGGATGSGCRADSTARSTGGRRREGTASHGVDPR